MREPEGDARSSAAAAAGDARTRRRVERALRATLERLPLADVLAEALHAESAAWLRADEDAHAHGGRARGRRDAATRSHRRRRQRASPATAAGTSTNATSTPRTTWTSHDVLAVYAHFYGRPPAAAQSRLDAAVAALHASGALAAALTTGGDASNTTTTVGQLQFLYDWAAASRAPELVPSARAASTRALANWLCVVDGERVRARAPPAPAARRVAGVTSVGVAVCRECARASRLAAAAATAAEQCASLTAQFILAHLRKVRVPTIGGAH